MQDFLDQLAFPDFPDFLDFLDFPDSPDFPDFPDLQTYRTFFSPLSQLSPYFRHHKDVDFTGYKGLRYLIRQAGSPEAIKCRDNRFESLPLFHSQPLFG